MSSLITVKLIAEQPNEATAKCFMNMTQARIAAFGSIEHSETKRYWKLPECFEVLFFLRPCIAPDSAFDSILSALGEGWEQHDVPSEEEWAVWNPKEGSWFFSSDVRWANVERLPESAVASQ
jgi:hypothetical protein